LKKGRIDFECPTDLQDPLGTCRDFNPSYDVPHRKRMTCDPIVVLRKLRKGINSEKGILYPATALLDADIALGPELLLDILDMEKLPPLLDAEAAELTQEGGTYTLTDLVKAVCKAYERTEQLLTPAERRTLYLKRARECAKKVDDPLAYAKAGCKRRAHILLPEGRESFKRLRPPDWKKLKDTSIAARGVTPKVRASEVTAREKREDKDLEPWDARTQSDKLRAYMAERDAAVAASAPVTSEHGEALSEGKLGPRGSAYARAIVAGVQRFAAKATGFEASLSPELYVKVPEDFEKLVREGVPEEAAKELSRKRGGAELRLKSQKPLLSASIRRIVNGDVSVLTPKGDKLLFYAEQVHLRYLPREVRPFVQEVRGFQRTETEKHRLSRQIGPDGKVVRLADGTPELGPPKRKRQETQQTEIYVSVSLVRASGQVVKLPVGEGKWPVAFDTLAKNTAGVVTVRVELYSPRLQKSLTLNLQHSKLFGEDARTGRTDYSSLEGFTLPEIAAILARKKFSPRRKLKGRTRDLYTPTAKTNPLPTFTLTPDDLKGPAISLGGRDRDGKVIPPGTQVPEMGPGTWKPYGVKNAIYWGTKEDADPKVVSRKRLDTWLTVARYGAKISSEARGGREEAAQQQPDSLPFPSSTSLATRNPSRLSLRNNPMPTFPKYEADYLANASHLNRATEAYYPGTMWDYYKRGEFGAEVAVPVNRRNPKAPKARKTSPAQASWRKEFAELTQKPTSKAIFKKHMIAAWALLLPESARRHPATQKALNNHVEAALNNPRKSGSPAQMSWNAEFEKILAKKENKRILHEAMHAAWAEILPESARRHPAVKAAVAEHVAGVLNNPNPYALDMGPYGPSMVPVNRRNPAGGGVKVARFPGTCAVCGGDFVPRQDRINDSGLRGPKGGVKMKHESC
jgi:hypothetical protein